MKKKSIESPRTVITLTRVIFDGAKGKKNLLSLMDLASSLGADIKLGDFNTFKGINLNTSREAGLPWNKHRRPYYNGFEKIFNELSTASLKKKLKS